ncbi:hypothetical protein CLAM6_31880 [Cobetia sp. AM6]|nr:hypothetical protein CLAM6_31880 [Cobetia sp. AM6]
MGKPAGLPFSRKPGSRRKPAARLPSGMTGQSVATGVAEAAFAALAGLEFRDFHQLRLYHWH